MKSVAVQQLLVFKCFILNLSRFTQNDQSCTPLTNKRYHSLKGIKKIKSWKVIFWTWPLWVYLYAIESLNGLCFYSSFHWKVIFPFVASILDSRTGIWILCNVRVPNCFFIGIQTADKMKPLNLSFDKVKWDMILIWCTFLHEINLWALYSVSVPTFQFKRSQTLFPFALVELKKRVWPFW